MRETAAVEWRTLALLYTVGAAIGAITLLLPHPSSFDDTQLWINIGGCFAAALLCLFAPRLLPDGAIHVVLLGGTLAITRAIYYSEEPSFYSFFYVWVGLFAFYFFGTRSGIAHMAAIGVAFAWVLGQVHATSGLARWMMTVATLAVGGLLIDTLVRRLRGLTWRFAVVATERAALMTKLEEVARTDDLTGLPNRRAWNESLVREVARARRNETPLCVAVLDLDRFKQYNDAHGHQAGDRLLKRIAGSWRHVLRTTDVLARYGGEEFTLALPGCNAEDASALTDRLREAIAEEQTCSAGVAEWDGSEQPDALVARADDALYRAKEAGRNRVMVSLPG